MKTVNDFDKTIQDLVKAQNATAKAYHRLAQFRRGLGLTKEQEKEMKLYNDRIGLASSILCGLVERMEFLAPQFD